MSTKNFLALKLEGPFQSWGFDSQFDYRKTGLMPTKSGIAGLCCAALGFPRGSQHECEFLERFNQQSMLSIAIPRKESGNDNIFLDVRRIRDYHTVQGTRKASGGIKNTHLTYRYYLQDACFGIILAGNSDFIEMTAKAIRDPVWGIWLGRKNCIPSSPIFRGIYSTEEQALNILLNGQHLSSFTCQRDVADFAEGNDTLPDLPVSFGTIDKEREFAPRRIKLSGAKI